MKKLVRKLALSCAALGVCAATLVSTTFAWYTSNTEVTATNVTGATADSGLASIFISQDLLDGETQKIWSSSVIVDSDNLKNKDIMKPLQYDGTKFTALGSEAEDTTGYLEFNLYFKTAKVGDGSGTTPLYLKVFKANNTTASINAFDNLVYDGSGTENIDGLDKSKPTYLVDAIRSLSLVMVNNEYATLKDYYYDITEGTKLGEVNFSNAINAHTYYEEIMGTTLTKTVDDPIAFEAADPSDTTGEGALKVADLANDGGETKITFKVFLNGWDQYCFDSCKGQSFGFEIAFTSDPKQAIQVTYPETE